VGAHSPSHPETTATPTATSNIPDPGPRPRLPVCVSCVRDDYIRGRKPKRGAGPPAPRAARGRALCLWPGESWRARGRARAAAEPPRAGRAIRHPRKVCPESPTRSRKTELDKERASLLSPRPRVARDHTRARASSTARMVLRR